MYLGAHKLVRGLLGDKDLRLFARLCDLHLLVGHCCVGDVINFLPLVRSLFTEHVSVHASDSVGDSPSTQHLYILSVHVNLFNKRVY